MSVSRKYTFMKEALEIAYKSARSGTGPFGCIVVKNGKKIASASNQVTKKNDPTAHAEIEAIRAATKILKSFLLTGCEIYTSSYPCPMCLGAIYWSRPKSVYFSFPLATSKNNGFDDAFIYQEFCKPNSRRKFKLKNVVAPESNDAFAEWAQNVNKVNY